MTHLSPAQAVDVAERSAAPAIIAHAASCEACRAKVDTLREAARLAAEDAPPEPSPLFWPHLAARIHEAVRRERAPARPWVRWVWRLVPAGVAALLVLALGVGFRLWNGAPAAPAGVLDAPAPQSGEAPADRVAAGDAPVDPSWLLVMDLSAQVSLDDAEESGALPLPGGVEKALGQLDENERVELARILREEMAALAPKRPQGPGA
ncbi:MAG: hypothetical protein R6V57_13710 [Vicinamibacterales bacterium]